MMKKFGVCSLSLLCFFLGVSVGSLSGLSAGKKSTDQQKLSLEEFEKKVHEVTNSFQESQELAAFREKLESKYPQNPSVGEPKYERSGHQYTSFIVALAAGLTEEEAYEISYFSQYPDDEIRFSATIAFLYFWDLRYRKQVMASLHSLHGGSHDQVFKRRANLKKMLATGKMDGSLEVYEIGLLIHAFADSYAHVEKLENKKLRAFSYGVGHLFHGHKPDIIAYDPDRYEEYVCELYNALSGNSDCQDVLSGLLTMIRKLKKDRDHELAVFESKISEDYGFMKNKYEEIANIAENKISDENIKKFITKLHAQIK